MRRDSLTARTLIVAALATLAIALAAVVISIVKGYGI